MSESARPSRVPSPKPSALAPRHRRSRRLAAARRSVIDLRAAPLEGRTLSQALTELVEEQGSNNRSELNIKVTGANHPLPQRVETGLYRIAQEALNNALLHAEAEHIDIELIVSSAETRMSIPGWR